MSEKINFVQFKTIPINITLRAYNAVAERASNLGIHPSSAITYWVCESYNDPRGKFQPRQAYKNYMRRQSEGRLRMIVRFPDVIYNHIQSHAKRDHKTAVGIIREIIAKQIGLTVKQVQPAHTRVNKPRIPDGVFLCPKCGYLVQNAATEADKVPVVTEPASPMDIAVGLRRLAQEPRSATTPPPHRRVEIPVEASELEDLLP